MTTTPRSEHGRRPGDDETASSPLTVGQVSERFGVTVRTLHHYDDVGLLSPSERSPAGYRRYTAEDLARLQHIVVYRRLGFALEQIATLLDDPDADLFEHLRRQRDAVQTRLAELRELVAALDHALEVSMSGQQMTDADRRELFGADFSDKQAEAERRWGDTDAWRESQRRTKNYSKQDWLEIQADAKAIDDAFLAAMLAGERPDSEAARDAAERHRQHITRRFYDVSYEMHRGLGDMYVADPRFLRNYDDRQPGLAQFVRDAIHANAEPHRPVP